MNSNTDAMAALLIAVNSSSSNPAAVPSGPLLQSDSWQSQALLTYPACLTGPLYSLSPCLIALAIGPVKPCDTWHILGITGSLCAIMDDTILFLVGEGTGSHRDMVQHMRDQTV